MAPYVLYMRDDGAESPPRASGSTFRLRELFTFKPLEVVVVALLLLMVIGGASLAWIRARPVPLELVTGEAVAASSVAPATPRSLWVHVAGAVRRPGVYKLPAGARAIDALRAAGGAGKRADLLAVNLARILADGEQLIIPRKQPRIGSSSGPGSASSEPATSLININTADQAELESLPGIGPALAQRIIEYREVNGPFSAVADLVNVSGIGEKTLANLEPYVTV